MRKILLISLSFLIQFLLWVLKKIESNPNNQLFQISKLFDINELVGMMPEWGLNSIYHFIDETDEYSEKHQLLSGNAKRKQVVEYIQSKLLPKLAKNNTYFARFYHNIDMETRKHILNALVSYLFLKKKTESNEAL